MRAILFRFSRPSPRKMHTPLPFVKVCPVCLVYFICAMYGYIMGHWPPSLDGGDTCLGALLFCLVSIISTIVFMIHVTHNPKRRFALAKSSSDRKPSRRHCIKSRSRHHNSSRSSVTVRARTRRPASPACSACTRRLASPACCPPRGGFWHSRSHPLKMTCGRGPGGGGGETETQYF